MRESRKRLERNGTDTGTERNNEEKMYRKKGRKRE